MKTKNEPAFPIAVEYDKKTNDGKWIKDVKTNFGLSKSEYLISVAMQGLLSNPSQIDTTEFKWIAKHAIGYADAVLEELSLENES